MGAPKGSKNGYGVKGRSGRKSAYQEIGDATRLWAIWTDPEKIREVAARMKKRNASLEDIFISLGHKKNSKILVEIFKKLHPEISKIDLTSAGKRLSAKVVYLPERK